MSSQVLVSCPKCGSTNIIRHATGEFECLSCGYRWGEGRRFGHPRTEEERRERHKERYGEEELPPRGAGLKQEKEEKIKVEAWESPEWVGYLMVLQQTGGIYGKWSIITTDKSEAQKRFKELMEKGKPVWLLKVERAANLPSLGSK